MLNAVQYCIEKLDGLQSEVEMLKSCDFVPSDVNDALKKTLEEINRFRLTLNKHEHLNPQTIDNICNKIASFVVAYLPLHGIFTHAADLRNSFELHYSLRLLSTCLLNRDPRLVLSAEWQWSPFQYIAYPSYITDYTIIGMPASESANPLVYPVAGHEIGHKIWAEFFMKDQLKDHIGKNLISVVERTAKEYKEIFRKDFGKEKDLISTQFVESCMNFISRQSEELFCDFIGISVFGKSYFYAFEYLLSNLYHRERTFFYPSMRSRVKFHVRFAEAKGILYPNQYESAFISEEADFEFTKQEAYARRIVDEVVQMIVDYIGTKAHDHCLECGVQRPTEADSKRILAYFQLGIPASANDADPLQNFLAIIDAGWSAFFDRQFWSSDQYENLRKRKRIFICELILKSIENSEIRSFI